MPNSKEEKLKFIKQVGHITSDLLNQANKNVDPDLISLSLQTFTTTATLLFKCPR